MSVPRRPPAARRGFATLTAVALIALVAMALVATGSLFNAEFRRTQRATEEAQLRQLLLAGERAARDALAANAANEPGKPINVELPTSLTAGGARLSLTPAATAPSEGGMTVAVTARLSNVLEQRLTFARRGEIWELTTVETDGLRSYAPASAAAKPAPASATPASAPSSP
jgi:hypothetical protein